MNKKLKYCKIDKTKSENKLRELDFSERKDLSDFRFHWEKLRQTLHCPFEVFFKAVQICHFARCKHRRNQYYPEIQECGARMFIGQD